MYSNKKSFVTGVAILYLLMALYEFRWIDNLNEQLDDVEDRITFIELQMNDLEKEMNNVEEEINALNDKCDYLDSYISSIDQGIHSIEDTKEQIEEEIKEGEIEALAQIIEAEAGNQDYIGKCLVADVVLNRVDSDKFPNSVEEVIFEKHYRKSDGVWCYQFSTVKYGAYDKAGYYISVDSYAAARQEYESERLDDDILFFTAGYYNPCCIPAYVHGDHYFGY